MDITLRRTSKVEDLSRGRRVKREGQVLGLPTSESKRTKRNPMASFHNILHRPTITIKKSVLKSARDDKQVAEERDKSAPQGKTGPLKKKTTDRKADQENVDPVSHIPLPHKKNTFGNPFTKKQTVPAPLAPQQHLVKVHVPSSKGDTKPTAPLTNGTKSVLV